MTAGSGSESGTSAGEQWAAEQQIREEELDLQRAAQLRLDKELTFKIEEAKRSRWWNPLVIAVLGAALAAVGNAGVTWQTGRNQIRLEAENNHNNRELETLKAEAARILESIKTNNVDQAAINLKFLIDAGLVRQPETVSYIQRYLDKRSPGQSGPVLPSPTVNLRDFESDDTRTRRQARETAAAEGSLIVPDLAKLLAANREKANYNYRQVLGAIVALGNMDQNTRCTEYAKNPELRQDVERWQQFKDLTMRHAAANALACSP